MWTQVKTPEELQAMRTSGHILAAVLDKVEASITAGVTTKDLAEIAKQELKALGGQPTFLGYNNFRDVLCVSVNEEVVHGIPGPRILQAGDIVSIDFGVTYNGMITDAARSVIIPGKKNYHDQELLAATRESLLAGITAIHGDTYIGDISCAVQKVLDEHGYGIVRDLVGHGVGHHLHEEPNIPNYGRKGTGPLLQVGMTVAIEPMATLGTHKVYLQDDNWTVVTQDGSRAAHFEHTVLITEAGAEILAK